MVGSSLGFDIRDVVSQASGSLAARKLGRGHEEIDKILLFELATLNYFEGFDDSSFLPEFF